MNNVYFRGPVTVSVCVNEATHVSMLYCHTGSIKPITWGAKCIDFYAHFSFCF